MGFGICVCCLSSFRLFFVGVVFLEKGPLPELERRSFGLGSNMCHTPSACVDFLRIFFTINLMLLVPLTTNQNFIACAQALNMSVDELKRLLQLGGLHVSDESGEGFSDLPPNDDEEVQGTLTVERQITTEKHNKLTTNQQARDC